MENENTNDARQGIDYFLALVTFGSAGVVFAPVLIWLFSQANASEQLMQALILLGALGGFLAWENKEKLKPDFAHDWVSQGLLIAAYILVALQIWLHTSPLIILLALLLCMGGLLRFSFGARAAVATVPFLLAFGLFSVLAWVLPAFDWPLRIFSGQSSAALLHLLGSQTNLFVATNPEPHLILEAEGHPFIVAAECNGFGALSSLLLLTITLGFYRKVAWLHYALLIVLSVVLAAVANVLRIVTIVLLAPQVSDYHLMHEVVGILYFYSALGLAGWGVWNYPWRRAAKSSSF